MRLFYSAGCPYAQRTRALLAHLGHPFEAVELDLAHKPPEFLALSPTGRVPMLEDDGFLLYESAIIDDYLAEVLGWREGVGATAKARARQRLAMTQFDAVLVPAFFKLFKTPALAAEVLPAATRELEQLGKTVEGQAPASVLGFHLATFWLRWSWADPGSALVAQARATPGLGAWLDAAAALPAVQQTSPEREKTVKELRARFG